MPSEASRSPVTARSERYPQNGMSERTGSSLSTTTLVAGPGADDGGCHGAAAARRRASSEIADGSAAGADGMLATAGGFVAIVSSRNSIGTETNTGPWGAAIASWQARWMVDGRSALVFRP